MAWPPTTGPREYADEFLGYASRAVRDLCERRGCELESLTWEVTTGATGGTVGATGGTVVAATAVVLFRGHRCVYRRRVWPPNHPAPTRAGIYATLLEECLLTRVRPAPGGHVPTLDL
ncbi:hypothetical protein [Streptomyces sp. NPDC046821]|uniref:hypothetical protein n=1 Tax=Streptomyces sp. NPDC046821 TaxID=3154702 RepID=UPI0033D8E6B6